MADHQLPEGMQPKLSFGQLIRIQINERKDALPYASALALTVSSAIAIHSGLPLPAVPALMGFSMSLAAGGSLVAVLEALKRSQRLHMVRDWEGKASVSFLGDVYVSSPKAARVLHIAATFHIASLCCLAALVPIIAITWVLVPPP